MPKIYVGSALRNIENARLVMQRLRNLGATITYDWTVHGRVYGAEERRRIAESELAGVREASAFLFLGPGRFGTHVEFGAALAFGIPIVISGQADTGSAFYYHPAVARINDLETALITIIQKATDYEQR